MMTTAESKTMGFSEISTLLWREREALQLLLFKLVEEQLIVSAGQTRWLAQANDEVEAALLQLHGTDVLRAAEVDAVAEDLGLAEAPSLADLEANAPEPWATMFGEHRQALLLLVEELGRTAGENRALLSAGARAVRETLLSVTRTVETYDSRGSIAAPRSGPMFMDEQA